MQEEEDQKKPNPVVQRVKIIMALGLIVVHLHGWFLTGITGLSFGFAPQTEEATLTEKDSALTNEIEKVPLQEYLLWKVFNLSGDQVCIYIHCRCYMYSTSTLLPYHSVLLYSLSLSPIPQIVTLALSAVLFVKYIFLDKSTTFESSGSSPTLKDSPPLPHISAYPIMMNGISRSRSNITHRHTANSGSNTYAEECAYLSEPLAHAVTPPPSVLLNGGPPTVEASELNSGRLLALTDGVDDAAYLKSFASVAIQTVADEERPIFSLSRSSSSDDSSVESSDETGEAEEERPQRSLAECLAIFKSDVSEKSWHTCMTRVSSGLHALFPLLFIWDSLPLSLVRLLSLMRRSCSWLMGNTSQPTSWRRLSTTRREGSAFAGD